jgi:pullulanase-type alpha-1,6-glucosidase
VDGKSIFMYGEGWNFGTVGNNGRGVNATQVNMAGTGIATFSDRLRDAVRGGGPFNFRGDQGFATGLFLEPNGTFTGTADAAKAELLRLTDLIRLGLAGNIASYPTVDRTGASVVGSQIDYFGMPGAYGQRADDTIQYIGVHDDLDWFDQLNVKLKQSVPSADRWRMYNLGLSVTLLSEGIPFMMAGDDILRSKSEDKNTYNSGDWFNEIDWSMQSNNWGVGLPPNASNGTDWAFVSPLLADPNLKPAPKDIQGTFLHTQELLRIRKSSRLFRLQKAADIDKAVTFFNTGPAQVPGLIVERIVSPTTMACDCAQAVVLVNANPTAQTFSNAAFKAQKLRLHPVLAASHDPVVRTSKYTAATGTFTIPARTTAVFVAPCP